MPRYKLRTLLILLAVLPPVGWMSWWAWQRYLYECNKWREFDGLAPIHDDEYTRRKNRP